MCLWSICPEDEDFEIVELDPGVMEGWYDPQTGEVIPDNHWMYYQYNLTDIQDPFYQEEGTIYWLEICSGIDPEYPGTDWGWKSSEDHWNDDAVWRDINDPNEVWHETFEPSAPITDSFYAFVDFGYVYGGGSGFDDGYWFYYENTGWYNQWFYDGVFDDERVKVVTIAFELVPFTDGWIEIALNYSTREWSELGYGNPPIPPLPPDEEDLYIRRVTLLEGYALELQGHHELRYVIREYNPEWVSIDVRADTTIVADINNGIIVHDCVQSLDLAFVITGRHDCPNPGVSGNFCTADCYPNNGDGVWNYPADDGDCKVNIQDLATLLAGYGMTSGATREDGDVYPVGGDGAVNIQDLAALLGQYGDDCN